MGVGRPLRKQASVPVEGGALVAEALLAGGQRLEVGGRLGHDVAIQTDDDAPRGLAADVDIEEDLVKWLKLVF